MNAEELELESHWFYPPLSVCYLQKAQLTIQIRNTSDVAQRLEKIECHFECEDNFTQYVPFVEPYVVLDPQELSSPIYIDFQIDLALKSSNNRYRITVFYSESKKIEFDPKKHFLINSIKITPTMFISHKDPEDTKLCRVLKMLLYKVGINAFLAEDVHYLGKDFWGEKIIPAIKNSIAAIIMFTQNAQRDPSNILKEIGISSAYKKPLILGLESSVEIPDGFPHNIEYYRFGQTTDPNQMKDFVHWVFDGYRRGIYRPPR